MATDIYIASAQDIAQVDTIVFSGAWAAADTVSAICNGKTITVTGGSTMDTAAEYATALAEAMTLATTDSNSIVSDMTINAGGRQYGEFYDFVATASGATVTVTGVTPGKPFTLTSSETAAGSITHTTPTAATGKGDFGNAANFETGILPGTADTVVLSERAGNITMGLDNTIADISLDVRNSYTGTVGLPAVNRDNPGMPYTEYRQTHLDLPATVTTGTQAHLFGDIGSNLPARYTLKLDLGTVQGSTQTIIVNDARAFDGDAAIQLSGGYIDALTISRGSLEAGTDPTGNTVSLTQIFTQWLTNRNSDVYAHFGPKSVGVGTTTMDMNGGQVFLGADNIDTIEVRGGTLTLDSNAATYGATVLGVYNAGRVNRIAGAVPVLKLYPSGTFDNTNAQYSWTASAVEVRKGCSLLDTDDRATYPNGIDFVDCSPADVNWSVVENKTWTPSTI